MSEDEIKNDPVLQETLQTHPDCRWMYFFSRPHCEKKLYTALCAQGIPTYLPLISKTTEYSRRTYTRTLPMFPGYVFACTRRQGFDIGQINSALLRVNFLPEELADELLEDLKAVRKFELLALEHQVSVRPELVPGTPILITNGFFKGEYAIVRHRKNLETLIVNLRSVQMALQLEVPAEWCETTQEK